jgi:hypothetical protein
VRLQIIAQAQRQGLERIRALMQAQGLLPQARAWVQKLERELVEQIQVE